MKRIFFCCLATILLLHSFENAYCKEVKLATDIHFIGNTALKKRVDNFSTFFIPKSTQKFGICQEVSTELQFNKLKTILTGMENPRDSFFTVLRIYYGLDTNSDPYTVTLIYLPDIARYHNMDTFSFKTDPVATNASVYLNANFTSAYKFNSDKIQGLINSYKAAGYIKVNEYGVPGAAPRDLDFRDKDAEGIVFPFQEIEDFYGLNDNNPLYIISGAKHDDDEGYNFYRQSLIFSSDPPDQLKSNTISADLGALCPPRCTDAVVRVRQKPDGSSDVIFGANFTRGNRIIWLFILFATGGLVVGIGITAIYYRHKLKKITRKVAP